MTGTAKRRFEVLKIFRWVARISSLISILMLLMFMAGEGFDIGRISAEQWVGFLFFPIGLVAGFIVGWKREFLGGAIAVLSLLGFYLIYGLWISGTMPRGLSFLVFSLPGFLFLACGIYAYFAIGGLAKDPQ